MVAVVKCNVRGVRTVKTKSGQMYIYVVEVIDRFGIPELHQVVGLGNSRKQGEQSIPVNISYDRDRSGNIRGLRLWEVEAK
jgi:hypothetical protein